jgi:thiol-disulfide isomerase/thioredoxin
LQLGKKRPATRGRNVVIHRIRIVLAAALAATSGLGPGPVRAAGLAGQVKALAKEYARKSKELREASRQAKTDEETGRLLAELFRTQARYAKRFFDLAEDYPDDPAAAEALSWVVALTPGAVAQKGSDAQKALALLRRKYLRSAHLGRVVEKLGNVKDPLSLSFLRQALRENPHRDVKAKATFAMAQSEKSLIGLAETLARSKDDPETLASYEKQLGPKLFEEMKGKTPEEWAEECEKLFQSVADKYGDVKTEADGKETTLGREARRYLFVLRDLRVGRPVPDATLRDLRGKRFTLKGLRGKVVVLDFWATWCPPCKAMIPHERELVKRLKGKPFVLVGISADNRRSDLTDFLEQQPMPWTHCYNGRTGGLIDQWMIEYYPTIYVIDAKGVIRFKDVRGKDLDRAVDSLLKEAGKG